MHAKRSYRLAALILAPLAGSAATARREWMQDHQVPLGDVGGPGIDVLDDAGDLVPRADRVGGSPREHHPSQKV